MAANENEPKHGREGVADPSDLRDYVEAIDYAALELSKVRARVLNGVRDAFTQLRSSAQIFREIFFGVELPIRSPEDLIERAGGPYRLIPVSYKETGPRLFALSDVIDAIPEFERVFPIENFNDLAVELEHIREEGPDTGPMWFARDISTKHLEAALEREMRAIASGESASSILTRPRTPVLASCCCGAGQSPAALVATALASLASPASAIRWNGGAARRQEVR